VEASIKVWCSFTGLSAGVGNEYVCQITSPLVTDLLGIGRLWCLIPLIGRLLASYVDLTEQIAAKPRTVDESRWIAKAQFRMNGQVALDWPVRDILRCLTSMRFITAAISATE
jgi:hypothetical protein